MRIIFAFILCFGLALPGIAENSDNNLMLKIGGGGGMTIYGTSAEGASYAGMSTGGGLNLGSILNVGKIGVGVEFLYTTLGDAAVSGIKQTNAAGKDIVGSYKYTGSGTGKE